MCFVQMFYVWRRNVRIFLEVFSSFFLSGAKETNQGTPDISGAPNIDYTVGFLDLTTNWTYGPSNKDQGQILANLTYKLGSINWCEFRQMSFQVLPP